jgi:hypothetical protein
LRRLGLVLNLERAINTTIAEYPNRTAESFDAMATARALLDQIRS